MAMVRPKLFVRHRVLFVFLFAALLAASSMARAGSYAACILGRMPDTANDIAAMQINRLCAEEYPAIFSDTPQGSGRDLMNSVVGYDSGAACTVKLAKDTASRFAASRIAVACHRLYDEDVPWRGSQSQRSDERRVGKEWVPT